MNFRTSVKWIKTKSCTPPHRVTHPEKFIELFRQFSSSGWNNEHPPLLGYQMGPKIQLISGSHRWAAAHRADIKIPVVVYPEFIIHKIWGTEDWLSLLEFTTTISYKK